MASSAESRARFSLWWSLTGVLLTARLGLAAWLPLGDDEGYYWVWSRHLAAGYYDHPPLVAWLVALSTRLCGSSLLALRLPFVLMGTLTAFHLRALVAEAIGDRGLADRASLLLQLVPVFFGLGVLVAPDGPLLLFWVLAGRAAWRVHERRDRVSWLLLGGVLGAALLSKYIGILLAPCVAACLWRAGVRPRLFHVAIAVVIALLLFAPDLWWNAHHDWASFRYQFFTRHQGGGIRLTRLGLFLGSQMLYLSPLVFAIVLGAAARIGLWKRDAPAPGAALLWWMGVPTIGLFLVASAYANFKPNWPAPGYLTLLPLALDGLEGLKTDRPRLHRTLAALVWSAALGCAALPVLQIAHPFLPLPRGADPSVDMAGWPEIADRVERAARELASETGAPPFIAAGRYQLASRLEFHLRGHPPVFCLDHGRDAYDDWQDLSRLRGRPFVFVSSTRFPDPPSASAVLDSSRVFATLVAARRPHEGFLVTVHQARGYAPRESRPPSRRPGPGRPRRSHGPAPARRRPGSRRAFVLRSEGRWWY